MAAKEQLQQNSIRKVRDLNSLESGMTLVSSLVALAVSSIVMMGMMSMMGIQQRETRSLFEMIGSLEVEKILLQNLIDGEICTYMLTDKAYDSSNPMTFDETKITSAKPPTISIPGNKIVGSLSAKSTDDKSILKLGEAASVLNPNLVVNDMKISDISDLGGNRYLASIEVGFDSSKLVRALKPIKIRTILRTDSSSPRKLVGCGNAATASIKSNPVLIKKQHRWYISTWVYNPVDVNYSIFENSVKSTCAGPALYETLRNNKEGNVYSSCTESTVNDALMFCYSDSTGFQQVACP